MTSADQFTFLEPYETLTRVGLALYGPRWQSTLARDLGITARVLRYYATGRKPVPSHHWRTLAAILATHADAIDAALDDVTRLTGRF